MVTAFDRTTLALALLVAGLYFYLYQKTGGFPYESAGRAGSLLLNILPKLVLGFFFGVTLGEALPESFVESWLSAQSGWRGLFFGWIAGLLMPVAAPFVLFPMAAGLLKAGAGVGPLVALMTTASLFGFPRIIIYEIPIVGMGFFVARFAAAFWMPLAAGALAQWVWNRIA